MGKIILEKRLRVGECFWWRVGYDELVGKAWTYGGTYDYVGRTARRACRSAKFVTDNPVQIISVVRNGTASEFYEKVAGDLSAAYEVDARYFR